MIFLLNFNFGQKAVLQYIILIFVNEKSLRNYREGFFILTQASLFHDLKFADHETFICLDPDGIYTGSKARGIQFMFVLTVCHGG
jgi:hypothetical protein